MKFHPAVCSVLLVLLAGIHIINCDCDWKCGENVYLDGSRYFKFKHDPGNKTLGTITWEHSREGTSFTNIMVKTVATWVTVISPGYVGRVAETCPTMDCQSGDNVGVIIANPDIGVHKVTVIDTDGDSTVYKDRIHRRIEDVDWPEKDIVQHCAKICQNKVACRDIDEGTPGPERPNYNLTVDLRDAAIRPPTIKISILGNLVKTCTDSFFCEYPVASDLRASVIIVVDNGEFIEVEPAPPSDIEDDDASSPLEASSLLLLGLLSMVLLIG